MGKSETTPSESEWLIMEVFWENARPLTSSEVSSLLPGSSGMTLKMIRVLMNRLCQKGLLSYTIDEKDARTYHYSALRSREECMTEKSRRFMDSYFKGSPTNAMAALVRSVELTDEQFEELEQILKKSRDGREKSDGGA